MKQLVSALTPLIFLAVIQTGLSAIAAEEIYFKYGPIKLSLSVDSLAQFSEEGKVNKELAFYLGYLSESQQQQFQNILKLRLPISASRLYPILRSYEGEMCLNYFGEFIQIPGGRNGMGAIRAALVQAAADPEGANLVNVLKKFPTDIQLDIQKLLSAIKTQSAQRRETKPFLKFLRSFNDPRAIPSRRYAGRKKDLRQPGAFTYTQQTLEFNDPSRQRKIPVDLYLPQTQDQTPLPLIIVSNGFGVPRNQGNTSVAHHLASYGFAVIIPDHPGSSRQQQIAFLQGRAGREMIKAKEFIDRPLDISFILDQLDEMTFSRLKPKFNLDSVGIFGHSYGTPAVFSLAGGKISPASLENKCKLPLNLTNISLVMQCSATRLVERSQSLKDQRIKAIFTLTPFNSVLFGEAGLKPIQIPSFIVGYGNDIFTPFHAEQLPAFNWLSQSRRYLALIQGVEHLKFNLDSLTQGDSSEANLINEIMQGVPDKVKGYVRTLSVAFFSAYLLDKSQFQYYLQAPYVRAIAEKDFPIQLMQLDTNETLDLK